MALNNPETAQDCEHGCAMVLDMKPEELALMAEGMCPGCKTLGERIDDWIYCSCCTCSWKINNDYVFIRARYVVSVSTN